MVCFGDARSFAGRMSEDFRSCRVAWPEHTQVSSRSGRPAQGGRPFRLREGGAPPPTSEQVAAEHAASIPCWNHIPGATPPRAHRRFATRPVADHAGKLRVLTKTRRNDPLPHAKWTQGSR